MAQLREHDLVALRDLASAVARGAGEVLRSGAEHGEHSVTTKSTRTDVVTDTDRASERYIVSVLRAERPDDAVLGEEGTSIGGGTGIQWVIDPLDGTVNFLYGLPSYAVSIAAVHDGVPVVGAVYNPAIDEMYLGALGLGSTRNGEPLSVGATDDLRDALVATGFAYSAERRAEQAEVVSRVLPLARDVRRIGAAALDLCNVASGRVDAYYELGVHPWDVLAGMVIATEAGAVVTGYDGGVPERNVVAANATLHPVLLDLVVGNGAP